MQVINRLSGVALGVVALTAPPGIVYSQQVSPPKIAPTALPPTAAPPVAPPIIAPAAPRTIKIPEGTEVRIELEEKLSSATSAEGDEFSVVTDEEIDLPDGAIIPAGYTGKGEVTNVSKAGMIGKSGQLNIRIDYLKIGSKHIHLRASKGGEGKSGVTNMVVTTVLFGPLGLLVRGHSIVYPKGQKLIAYVDEDSEISLPIEPPPKLD